MYKRLGSIIYQILLIGLAISAIASYPTLATASSSTHVYLLGVSNPTDPLVVKLQSLTTAVTLLPTVADLSVVGGGSILFVDGEWLRSAASLDSSIVSLLLGKVLAGVPTVTIRGDPSTLGDSMSGLVRLKAPNFPLIAEGLRVEGTLPDGTPQAHAYEVISGFDYAAEREFRWAEQFVTQAPVAASTALSRDLLKSPLGISSSEVSTEQLSSSPVWSFLGNLTIDTGDQFKPVARMIHHVSVYRLDNDGTEQYKWFNFFMKQRLQPGIMIYDSRFRNSFELDRVVPNSAATTVLVDRGPEALRSEGPETVTYDIGVTEPEFGAVVNATQSASYPIKHTAVTDFSQGSDVNLLHDIDSRTDAGKTEFTIIPGWTIRNDQGVDFELTADFDTGFDSFRGNDVETTPVQFGFFVTAN